MKENCRHNLHRRGFLAATGKTVVFANMLRAWPGLAAARDQTGDALVQPAAIQSRSGVLETALTAAPGAVKLGNLTFPVRSTYRRGYLSDFPLRLRTLFDRSRSDSCGIRLIKIRVHRLGRGGDEFLAGEMLPSAKLNRGHADFQTLLSFIEAMA